jgi:hypothetical protein
MLTPVAPAMPDEALSRPVTLQALPSRSSLQVREAVARPVTMQALPSQSSVQVREAVARPVTMQYLPAQQALRAGDAESRAATLQFLPARRSPTATEAIARAFTVGTLGVPLAVPSDSTVERALSSALHGTQPNPFQRVTLIHYSLAERAGVRLRVYDLAGRVVRALVMGEQGAGEHAITWDGVGDAGQRLAPGVYLCRLEAGAFDECRRVVLIGN